MNSLVYNFHIQTRSNFEVIYLYPDLSIFNLNLKFQYSRLAHTSKRFTYIRTSQSVILKTQFSVSVPIFKTRSHFEVISQCNGLSIFEFIYWIVNIQFGPNMNILSKHLCSPGSNFKICIVECSYISYGPNMNIWSKL